VTKILVRPKDFTAHDGVGERVLAVLVDVFAVGVGVGLCAEVVDKRRGSDYGAENIFCAGIAHNDVAVGCLCDDETDRHGVEDCLEASFAALESFNSPFVVVYIFDGAVPARDFSVLVPAWGSAGSHPAPSALAAQNTVLGVIDFSGADRLVPLFNCRGKIIGMNDLWPTAVNHVVLCDAGDLFASCADVENGAPGIGGPGYLRVEFDSVAIVIFAFGEGLFGLFAAGDVDD